MGRYWVVYRRQRSTFSLFGTSVGGESIEADSIDKANEIAVKRAKNIGSDVKVDHIKEMIT